MMQTTASIISDIIMRSGSYSYSERGFELASGRRSTSYFDMRRLCGDPSSLRTTATILYGKIASSYDGVGSIGGLESGSIALATALSLISKEFNMMDRSNPKFTSFYVRKEAKDHGPGSIIEGRPEGRCVVVDDVVTTGGSALKAVSEIRGRGYECAAIAAIMFRGGTDDRQRIGRVAPLECMVSEVEFLQQVKAMQFHTHYRAVGSEGPGI